MCPAQSENQALIDWAAKQPSWQQDALRRLASVGQASRLTDDDKTDLKGILVEEAKGEKPPFSPLKTDHLPSIEVSEPQTYLKTLGPISNVDRLASGQPPIDFVGPTGMTVIFGVNGSGKSGYARILKNLCRALGNPRPLKGDRTIPESRPDWEVNLTYSEDGNDTPLVWTKSKEETKPESLKRISVFDSETANIYVDGERGLHYLPLELRLLTELSEVAKQFGERYDEKIKKAKEDIIEMPAVPDGTSALAMVNRLVIGSNDLPSNEDIEAAATFSEANQSELDALLLQQAQTPEAKKQTLVGAQDCLVALKNQLDFCYHALSDQSLQNINGLFEDWTNKQGLAQAGAATLASDMPLPTIVGTDLWHKLFKTAREIATGTFPDADKPAIVNGDECVLCQQTLDNDARQRLQTFNAIIEGELQRASDEANNAYQTAIKPIIEATLDAVESVRQRLQSYAQLSDEREQSVASLVKIVDDMHPRLAAVRQIIGEVGFENETLLPPMPQIISTDLRVWLDEIASELSKMESEIQNGDTGLSLEQRTKLAELQGCKILADNKTNIINRLKALQTIALWEACKNLCQTRPITEYQKARVGAIITDNMTTNYQAELRELRLNYIRVEVERRGQKGRLLFCSKATELHGGKAKLSEILSEGEQRALALAGFLTEINNNDHAIIFDDPVSSFDWQRKGKIAERLVEEAKKRQVIIFTHDFSFALQLDQQTTNRNKAVNPKPFQMQWIGRKSVRSDLQFGVIGEDVAEWETINCKQRICRIEKEIKLLTQSGFQSDNTGNCEFDRWADNIANRLRQTWERAVEEVALNGVIMRLEPNVRTTNLNKVVFDFNSDYGSLHEGMSAISTPAHDTPQQGTAGDISIDDLQNNLDQLKAWVTSLKEKQNQSSHTSN